MGGARAGPAIAVVTVESPTYPPGLVAVACVRSAWSGDCGSAGPVRTGPAGRECVAVDVLALLPGQYGRRRWRGRGAVGTRACVAALVVPAERRGNFGSRSIIGGLEHQLPGWSGSAVPAWSFGGGADRTTFEQLSTVRRRDCRVRRARPAMAVDKPPMPWLSSTLLGPPFCPPMVSSSPP